MEAVTELRTTRLLSLPRAVLMVTVLTMGSILAALNALYLAIQ